MPLNFKKKIIVVYHGGCADGFGGAWAAWKKFGDKAHYYPASHGEKPNRDWRGKDMYLIDFSYPVPQMKALIAANRRVTSLDHHVSAEAATKMTHDYRYAVRRSGCVLAWRYFHPKRKVPKLLSEIEDIDLYGPRRNVPCAVRALTEVLDGNFPTWDRLARALDNPRTRRAWLQKGEFIYRYQLRLTHRVAQEAAQLVQFGGYRAVAVNSQYFEDFIPDAVRFADAPVTIIWRARKDAIHVSLRSDGRADVAKLAERFGGGGHKRSSGFELPHGAKFPWSAIAVKKRT